MRHLLLFILFISQPLLAEESDPFCEAQPSLCAQITEYQQVDQALNDTYSAIMKAIKEEKFDAYLVQASSLKESLKTAQRSWITFRNNNCDAVAVLFSGGTSMNYDQYRCLTEMTKQRVNFLQQTYQY